MPQAGSPVQGGFGGMNQGYGAPNQGFGNQGQAYGAAPLVGDPAANPGAMQMVAAQGGAMMAAPAAPGVHGPKGTVRSGVMCLVLSFVTFGIYQLIWFIKTSNEMSSFLQRDEPSWIKILALSIVTGGFYAIFWQLTKCGALVQECQVRAGVQNPQNHGWLYIVPYYNVILLTEELNRAWQGPA
jgi:hypothetical protein